MLGLAPLASLPFAAATDDADLRIVFAWGGTYVLTGQPIDLDADRKLHADAGAYSLIGKDITLNEHPPITGGTLLGFGPLASMPFAAANENAVVIGKTIDVETGVYTLTGQDVDVDADRKLYPFAGVYTLTGQPVDLDADRQLHVETGVYTLTGQDVDVDADRKLYPFAGVYILTGQDVD